MSAELQVRQQIQQDKRNDELTNINNAYNNITKAGAILESAVQTGFDIKNVNDTNKKNTIIDEMNDGIHAINMEAQDLYTEKILDVNGNPVAPQYYDVYTEGKYVNTTNQYIISRII